MPDDQDNGYYLLADSNLMIDFNSTAGAAAMGAGAAIVIHSYWHMWDPIMLATGGVLFAAGLLMNMNARSKRQEQLYNLRLKYKRAA